MKQKTILSLLFFVLIMPAFAQKINIQHLEPAFWWANMKNPTLQLLVHAQNIGNITAVESNNKEFLPRKIHYDKNKNYIFVDIDLSHAQPGTYELVFKTGNKINAKYQYELKKRESQKRGFSSEDFIYLAMPDRFSNANTENDSHPEMLEKANRTNPDGRHGGDLQGVINHLDYIQSLGVTALWLNPFLENNQPAYSYHGYAITDFYKTDPRYGNNELALKLTDELHNRNMKLIMDMIFNHSGINHWWMNDLPDNWIHEFDEFTRSNYRGGVNLDPYASDFDYKKMVTGWFDKTMPDLNQHNPFLATYFIQNSIWWIEYLKLDGIRLDTQPYPYKHFISQWAQAVHAEYPDFTLLGEAWLQKEAFTAYFQGNAHNPDGYNSHTDAVTDFPMYFATSKAFTENTGWTEGLARLYYVLGHDYLFGDPMKNVIFLDNHDLNRYATSIGNDPEVMKMAMGYLLTMRGIPMMYYGTEIMMQGHEHKGHGYIREDFPGGWPNEGDFPSVKEKNSKETLAHVRKVANWRKTNNAVKTGKLKHFIPENNTYVYFRYTEKECVMVAINSDKNDTELDLKRFQECLKTYTKATEIVSGNEVELKDKIKLKGKTTAIFELK